MKTHDERATAGAAEFVRILKTYGADLRKEEWIPTVENAKFWDGAQFIANALDQAFEAGQQAQYNAWFCQNCGRTFYLPKDNAERSSHPPLRCPWSDYAGHTDGIHEGALETPVQTETDAIHKELKRQILRASVGDTGAQTWSSEKPQ
jgi:hypothetical protein